MSRWSNVDTRESMTQLIRYGVVGLSTNAVGYILYLSLTYWGMGSKLAMSMLYCVSIAIGFVGNRRWTFSDDGGAMSAGGRYLVVYGLGYLINLCILRLFVDWLGYYHAYVQGCSILVVAVFIFVSFKFFVFPNKVV